MGLTKLGAGCPTGPAMPPGRWLGLGGTCAPPLAAGLQHMLPIRGQSHGSRRYLAGGFSPRVSDGRELSFGAWWICHVDDKRDAKSADRPLSPDETRPCDRFAGRRHAGGGDEGVRGAAAGRAGAIGRAEQPSADSLDAAFARIARSGNFAGSAAIGICRDSAGPERPRRNREITDQPRTHRTSAYIATNGCEAIMKLRTKGKNLVFVEATIVLPVGVEP
jgi:hypothetical protein